MYLSKQHCFFFTALARPAFGVICRADPDTLGPHLLFHACAMLQPRRTYANSVACMHSNACSCKTGAHATQLVLRRQSVHGNEIGAGINVAASVCRRQVADDAVGPLGIRTRFCVVSFTSDGLFPTSEARAVVHADRAAA